MEPPYKWALSTFRTSICPTAFFICRLTTNSRYPYRSAPAIDKIAAIQGIAQAVVIKKCSRSWLVIRMSSDSAHILKAIKQRNQSHSAALKAIARFSYCRYASTSLALSEEVDCTTPYFISKHRTCKSIAIAGTRKTEMMLLGAHT